MSSSLMLFPVTERERLNRSKLTRLRISLDALPVEIPAVALALPDLDAFRPRKASEDNRATARGR